MRSAKKKQPHPRPFSWQDPHDPYIQMWRALKPFERLQRAWRLRTRLKNPQAIHDAKTFPKL